VVTGQLGLCVGSGSANVFAARVCRLDANATGSYGFILRLTLGDHSAFHRAMWCLLGSRWWITERWQIATAVWCISRSSVFPSLRRILQQDR
jgi:hypothetical protein